MIDLDNACDCLVRYGLPYGLPCERVYLLYAQLFCDASVLSLVYALHYPRRLEQRRQQSSMSPLRVV